MNNKRNDRTTFPRKAARRARALDRFTVKRVRMEDAGYMTRKATEWSALTGSISGFSTCVQRLGK